MTCPPIRRLLQFIRKIHEHWPMSSNSSNFRYWWPSKGDEVASRERGRLQSDREDIVMWSRVPPFYRKDLFRQPLTTIRKFCISKTFRLLRQHTRDGCSSLCYHCWVGVTVSTLLTVWRRWERPDNTALGPPGKSKRCFVKTVEIRIKTSLRSLLV